LYRIIALIGIYIRTCVLPNPFAPLDGVMLFGAPVNADMANLIAESFIHLSVYNFVGRFYHRGSDPAFGSISYMVCYVLAVFLLYGVSWFVSFVLRIVG